MAQSCSAWHLVRLLLVSTPKLGGDRALLLSEPVAALVLDYFWLNKTITLIQWLGAILTMFAIYLGSVKVRH